jgi:nitrous oxidase accessory protein NosD
MKRNCLLMVVGIVCLSAVSLSGYPIADRVQAGGDEPAVAAPDRGWPGGEMFPGHDPAYTIINLTNNGYGDDQSFPQGYYFKYAGFNSDGARIAVSARNQVGGVSQYYEIWVMDYDAATQTLSNFRQVTSNAGSGDIAMNTMPAWSRSDPDLLLYLETHNTTANTIMTYDVGAAVTTKVYDPALDSNGDDVTNPGFFATSNSQYVFGSGYGSGNDRILLFTGAYPSVTISSSNQNLDPACNYDGTRVTYYSTNATYGQGSIFADNYASSWTERVNGFGDPALAEIPGYWAFYSGQPTNMILAFRDQDSWSSAAGLGLYHASGSMITDLLGDGGTQFKWTYANHNWRGAQGEILFRSEEYTHSGYGNNIFIATGAAPTVYVDDDWTGPENCGGLAWGFDAFASVQAGLNAVTDGGTVIVYSGAYEEQVVITRSVTLQGQGLPTITAPATGLRGYTIPESGGLLYPMVFAYGGTDNGSGAIAGNDQITISLKGFRVDHGNTVGLDRTAAVLFRNCEASAISENTITGLLPATGNPRTMGILVYGHSDLRINSNLVEDWTRGGISGYRRWRRMVDPQADITGNTVAGEGPLGVGYWAQNGIQVSDGAFATIAGNTVSDIAYTGPSWAASGINVYLAAAGMTLSGNEIHDCQAALYLTYADDVTSTGNNFWNNEYVIAIGGTNISFVEDTYTANDVGIWIGDASDVQVTRCEFSGNAYALAADGVAANLTYINNKVVGSTEAGFLFDEYLGDEPTGIVLWDNGLNDNAVGVQNLTAVLTDASGNWWGDATGPATGGKASVDRLQRPARCDFADRSETNPHRLPSVEQKSSLATAGAETSIRSGSGDAVSANVDYTPWLAGGATAGQGFAGDFSILHCDDDSPQNGTVAIIQEAVNLVESGGTVHVVAGAYQEQVEIAKAISLIGESTANTVLQSPLNLNLYFVTGSNNNYPILYLHDVDATVANLTIDGLGRGNANYRFTGIGMWNAGGSLTDIALTGVRDNPFSGAQHGVSVYAYTNDGAPRSLSLTRVTVTDMQKTGIVMSGSGLTVTATECQVTGQGHTSTTAQNGIQVSLGADASLIDCTVSDIGYTGSGWVATGLLMLQAGTVGITGGSVTGSQASVIYQETNGSVDGLTVTSSSIVSAEGISVRDYGAVKAASLAGRDLSPASPFDAGETVALKALSTDVTITDVTLTGVHEAGSYGVAAWALGDDVAVALTESDIANWEIGVVAYESGSLVHLTAGGNAMVGNDLGAWSNASLNLSGPNNYWGSVLCADVVAQVDGAVIYEPWCNSDFTQCDFYCAVSEVWVDDDWVGSTPGQDLGGGMFFGHNAFENIPSALAGVTDGGLIHVLPGMYPTGQILFDKNVTVSGDAGSLPLITATTPTVSPTSWFYVSGYAVDCDHLSFDATGVAVKYAIGYWNAGAGTVTSCKFNAIQQSTYIGCAVLHYSDTDFSIEGCEFTNCGRQGVFVFGYPARTRVIRDNTYTGKGAVDGLDYAVEVGGGASALIEHNVFTNCTAEASSDGSASAGILATDYYGGGTSAVVIGNTIENNTMGIAVGYNETDATLVDARENRFVGNTFAGVSNVGAGLIEATASWWGDIDGPAPVTKSGPVSFRVPSHPDGQTAPIRDNKDGSDGLVHYSPWVASNGGDADAFAPGWQPNLSAVGVSTNGTIQQGIDLVNNGGLVAVQPGLYAERVVIGRAMTVRGATHTVNKNGYAVPPGYAWDDHIESIISNPEPALSDLQCSRYRQRQRCHIRGVRGPESQCFGRERQRSPAPGVRKYADMR